MRTPPTHRPEFVRSLTSIASAIAARSVPTLEPSVDEEEQPEAGEPERSQLPHGGRRTVAGG